MHSAEIRKFIRGHKYLFWGINDKAIENISIQLLVETILNYGNECDLKQLFNLVGLEKVAEIFYEQISKKSVNYSPRTENYFKLYFKKHAQRDTNRRSN